MEKLNVSKTDVTSSMQKNAIRFRQLSITSEKLHAQKSEEKIIIWKTKSEDLNYLFRIFRGTCLLTLKEKKKNLPTTLKLNEQNSFSPFLSTAEYFIECVPCSNSDPDFCPIIKLTL